MGKINVTALELVKLKISFCKEDVFDLCDPHVALLTLETVAEMCAEKDMPVEWPELLDER